jgi:phosphatidylglycerol lysyltransferase
MIYTVIGPIVPLLVAGLATLSGSILLISGNLPSDPGRLGFLKELLPLGIVETSHLIGSVVGVLLMIVARGLYRRMFRAWLLAMVLLGSGFLASLFKGFDWEEALTLGAAAVILWIFRSAFYRADVTGGLRLNWKWIFSVSLLVVAIRFWLWQSARLAFSHIPTSSTLTPFGGSSLGKVTLHVSCAECLPLTLFWRHSSWTPCSAANQRA